MLVGLGLGAPLVFALAVSTVPGWAQSDEKGADNTARHEALRAVLHGLCASPRTPHANSLRLPALQLTRVVGPDQRGPVGLVQPLRCGFGEEARGRLDLTRARETVQAIGRIYGVRLQDNVSVGVSGFEVRLPLADSERKLGFAFRNPSEPERKMAAGTLLGSGAAASLRRNGWQIHYVDLARFRAPQGDTLSPVLAYAVSAIDFLERSRPLGFDLRPFLGAAPRELRYGRAGLALDGASGVRHDARHLSFRVATAARLRVRCTGVPKVRGQGMALVVFGSYWTPPFHKGYDFSGPRPRFVLAQGRLRVRSERGVFLLPRGFSPGQPFEVAAELPPGEYHFPAAITVRPGRTK